VTENAAYYFRLGSYHLPYVYFIIYRHKKVWINHPVKRSGRYARGCVDCILNQVVQVRELHAEHAP